MKEESGKKNLERKASIAKPAVKAGEGQSRNLHQEPHEDLSASSNSRTMVLIWVQGGFSAPRKVPAEKMFSTEGGAPTSFIFSFTIED